MTRRHSRRAVATKTFLVAFGLVTIACERSALTLSDGCQPLLAGQDCLLPYPSDFFREPDPSLPGGHRVETRGAAKLVTAGGESADVADWRPIDGFSRVPSIVALIGQPISSERLVDLTDPPESSLVPSSATLLIRADSGETVPHFVDLDPLATSPDRQAIILHPLVGLEEATRYVVAFHGLEGPSGERIYAPEGFRRLRDREADGDPSLRSLITHYEDAIFPVIERAGVPRPDMVLAWDFTTGSDVYVHDDMLRVRELVLEEIAARPPAVEIEKVVEYDDDRLGLWRTIHGSVRGPRVLESDEEEAPLARDGDGRVRLNGTISVPFIAQVPISIRDDFSPARAIAYGHGFFGNRREVEKSPPIHIANRLHAVVFAIDWWGMRDVDRIQVIDALVTRPSHTLAFGDGVHQSMANWLTMTAAIRDALTREPSLARPGDPGDPGVAGAPDGRTSNRSALIYDPEQLSFLGVSQGHILGGVQAAINPTIDRICLNVGGAGFTQIMFRARPFLPFYTLLEYPLPDPLDRQKFAATLQRHFDRFDPASYAPLVLKEKLPDSPPDRQILLQIGLGDTEVPNIAAFLHARLLGIGITSPSPLEVFGLRPHPGGQSGSALTLFDFGLDTSFSRRADPNIGENEAHEGVRLLDSAMIQLDAFFRRGGTIRHPCDGPCDPE